jgi:prepilin-type N-terminal cleavage/methylation domain-containing protein
MEAGFMENEYIERLRTMPYTRSLKAGFTLVEILIVVVILSIASLTAIPMLSNGASMQIRSAANVIASDLEYAKSMAISRGQYYSVIFDKNTESYRIVDKDSNVIQNPVKLGSQYIINFSTDSRLSKVDITNVNFNSTNTVRFDYIGSPNNGGTVTLQAGSNKATINVEPVTGYITVQ